MTVTEIGLFIIENDEKNINKPGSVNAKNVSMRNFMRVVGPRSNE